MRKLGWIAALVFALACGSPVTGGQGGGGGGGAPACVALKGKCGPADTCCPYNGNATTCDLPKATCRFVDPTLCVGDDDCGTLMVCLKGKCKACTGPSGTTGQCSADVPCCTGYVCAGPGPQLFCAKQ